MIKEHQLETYRAQLSSAFSAGATTFPNYTLHGQEHLEELDRIALLLCDAIPSLQNDEEKRNKLRLAIILHDSAMFWIPSESREKELRTNLEPGLSLAEVIRKTHQNEIFNIFTEQSVLDGILSTFSGVPHTEIEEACTIAQHHRFHPLGEAPDHLQALCALMRLIDELEIGPKRAPTAAYVAKRNGMDPISRFHWLKHICTQKIQDETTFNIEHGSRVTLPGRLWKDPGGE